MTDFATLMPYSLTTIPSEFIIYFHYGLAFIILGCVIAVKNLTGSKLKLAGSLHFLALFGLFHGTHEWVELYLLIQKTNLTTRDIVIIKELELFFGVLSFMFLFQFGTSLLFRITSNTFKWQQWLRITTYIVWTIGCFFIWRKHSYYSLDFVYAVDILTRNTFGLTSSIITSIALIYYSRSIKDISNIIGIYLSVAGVAFGLYGIFAGVIPSKTILPYIFLPIEVARTIAAIIITIFMVKALNIFDIETREKLLKQLEFSAQSEKLTSLGELAAGVAHEINNPLSNALLNLQLVKKYLGNKTHSNKKIILKLKAIDNNIDRASSIARELLQFSRDNDTHFAPLFIDDIIKSSLRATDYKLDKIKIIQNLGNTPKILGDQLRLHQVFINIFNNCIDAMNHVGVITINSSTNNDRIKIEITDTGHGIPDQNGSKLFDPFFTTKTIGSGTGLGLSICYGIIKQHDGEIEISNAKSCGTTTTISLPVMKKK